MPDAKESAELAAMLVRLRRLTVVTARLVLAKAMEGAVQEALDSYLARIKSADTASD